MSICIMQVSEHSLIKFIPGKVIFIFLMPGNNVKCIYYCGKSIYFKLFSLSAASAGQKGFLSGGCILLSHQEQHVDLYIL